MALLLPEGPQAVRPLRTFSFAFGATATEAGSTLNSKIIRVHTTAAVCITLDGEPAGTATSIPMAADQTEYFLCATGQKLGAIARDSGAAGVIGRVYWSEI